MRRGFVSFIFLVIFMNCISLVSIICMQVKTQAQILSNVIKINKDITIEAAILAETNCYLKNSEVKRFTSTVLNVEYEAIIYDEYIDVMIYDSKRELYLIIDSNRKEVSEIVFNP